MNKIVKVIGAHCEECGDRAIGWHLGDKFLPFPILRPERSVRKLGIHTDLAIINPTACRGQIVFDLAPVNEERQRK